MLMIGVMGVVFLMAMGAMCMATYLTAIHQARGAADLAALSGAVAIQSGADGCSVARRVARENQTTAVSCDQTGDTIDFVISVRVARAVRLEIPGLPTKITALAHAGPTDQ
jgi:secretion/DNA translocation related TadE-like protein